MNSSKAYVKSRLNLKFLGQTSVYLAIKNEHQDIVQLLVEHGADVNPDIYPIFGTTLYYAVQNGNIDIVKILLDKQVDVRALCKSFPFKLII